MAGHTLLLNLLGGVALLVWATQMVRKGVMEAFGARLRHAIAKATDGRVTACATGLGVATALQSSSATGLLVVAFAERGLIALAPALAVMLGADIGSTIVVDRLDGTRDRSARTRDRSAIESGRSPISILPRWGRAGTPR